MIKRHQNGIKSSHSLSPNAKTVQSVPMKKTTPSEQAGEKPKMIDWFNIFAHKTSEFVGKPLSFCFALIVIIVWAIIGPLFGFSDTWQLVINTATTIVTFLMVFLIQNTQNRDAKAFHLKLDELIHAIKGARNRLIDLEECSDEELAKLEEQFKRIGKSQRGSRPSHQNSDK
jgi:low affinity Fe/Cu permease